MKTVNKNIIHYIIFLLYMLVPRISAFGALDFSSPQWLYVSVLNFAVLVYFVFKPNFYFDIKLSFPIKAFFTSLTGFLIIALLSTTKSIIVSESILSITRILVFIISVWILFVLFIKTKLNFLHIATIVSFFLLIEVFETVYYFYSNYSIVRSSELLSGLPNNYGNINVLGASIALKFPFAIYTFYKLKGIQKYFFIILPITTVTSVFLIGARTSTLIIALQLVLFSLLYFIHNKFSLKKSYLNILLLSSITVVGLFLYTLPNKIYNGKKISTEEIFFTKSEKFLLKQNNKKIDISRGSGRAELWVAALKDFNSNPWIGVGIGNWRYTSKDDLLKIDKGTDFVFHTSVHNDYLQFLSETGLFGFLFYLGYISIIIFLVIKLFIISSTKDKMIYATLIMALIAYLIDAFFNFPHNRTPIQVLFVITVALVLAYFYKSGQQQESNGNNIKIFSNLSYGIIIFAASLIVINVMDYVGSVSQFKLVSQIQSGNPLKGGFKIKYNEAKNEIKSFPEVNPVGMSNDDVLAVFAINEKKYDLAVKHLNASIKKLPNSYYSKYLLATIYDNKKDIDSTFLYSKMVFDKYPGYDTNFTLLTKILDYKKDTMALFKAHKKHLKAKFDNYICWMNYAEAIRIYKRDDNLALKKIDSLLNFEPNDIILLTYKKELQKVILDKTNNQSTTLGFTEDQLKERSQFYELGNSLFSESKFEASKNAYLEVLNIDSNNMASKYQLGLVEVKLKNYSKAIFYLEQVIASNLINDGKPEYNIGFSYFKLNKIENAKSNFTKSYLKEFPLAKKLDPRMLNL